MRYTPKAVSMWNIRFEMILTSGFGFLKPLDLGYPTGSKPNQCLKLLPCWHGLATKQCPEADVMEASTGKQSALK